MADNYHDRSELSRSDLAEFIESRSAYGAGSRGDELEGKLCIKKGSSTHWMLLEPEKFESLVYEIPADIKRRGTNAYKDWARDLPDGAIDLHSNELKDVEGMASSVRSLIGEYLYHDGATFEESIYWTEIVNGVSVPCRCKPDIRITTPKTTLLFDVKTIGNIHGFRKAVRYRRYWLQDSHYSSGVAFSHDLDVDDFFFVIVESSFPYRVRMKRLSPGTRQQALDRRRFHLEQLVECRQSGDWADPVSDEIETLDIDLSNQ